MYYMVDLESDMTWTLVIAAVVKQVDDIDVCLCSFQILADMNMEDGDIEPAPKLIQVLFQNCKGQVDQWVEPYIRVTFERLRRAKKSYLKCLLVQVVRSR